MIKEVRRGNNLERVGGGGMVSSEEISFIGIQYSTGGGGGGWRRYGRNSWGSEVGNLCTTFV